MRNRFTRAVALAALAVGLSTSPAVAQNGSNFMVLNNGFDAIYGGIGAGGGQVGGVDGIGTWIDGENMRGNTMTQLGDFGYKQIGWREAPCVLGPAIPGLGLKFPAILVLEFDGVNPYGPGNVFTLPVCGTPGCLALGNSAGVAPYGAPAGSSAAFLLTGFASGVGLPSGAVALIPNNGIAPSSNGGTAFVIAAASGVLPIASTGFCWGVQFGWVPSAVAALDDINGWWTWRTNSGDNNQYWSISTDENNIWQSDTVLLDGGATGLIAFLSNLDYETCSIGSNPSTNPATAPVGAAGTGVYYAIGPGVPLSGNSFNGGFDMGRHDGLSMNGPGGTVSGTGLGGQDPLNSTTPGLLSTLGFVTWNNSPSSLIPGVRHHVTWVQIAFDMANGVDPALTVDLPLAGGNARFPISDQVSFPGAIQPETNLFASLFLHTVNDQSTLGNLWPDPFGFPGGTFGIPPVVGSSSHFPTGGGASVALGVPIGFQAATSQLGTSTGPLLWGGPVTNAPSHAHIIPLVD